MSKIIGIDLGTTNSAMAAIQGGKPGIIENKEGARTTPSVVALSKTGERLVGVTAKRQGVTNPENTIFSAKRLVGRKFSDPEVQKDKELLPYTIKEGKSGGVEITLGDKDVRPEEVLAMILQKMKQDAEERLGDKVTEAVITVPAYFDDAQRKATKDAGVIAGLDVKRIINEPTAAALAYGLEKKKNEQIVVYDFGGGTFDVSVLEVSQDTIEVKATGGDTHLGGDDFDQKIIDWIVSEYKKSDGIDLSKDRLALQRLKESAERAKHELSSTNETEINIPFITSDASGPRHLTLKLTREKLEELVDEYVKRAEQKTKEVIKDSGFDIKDIDEVVLVGGQTRMPAIQESVKNLFGKDPHRGINPDEVVAMGAAIQAGILQGDVKDVLLLDVTPLSLGIETLGSVMTRLIDRNSTIPTQKQQIFSTAADNQTSVEIHVLQGEREMSGDNKTLGRFILSDIPPSPRGVPQVEVSFDIDANGILKVSAKDKASGKEQSIRIEGSSGISEEDIEKMKKDAELHEVEDKKKRELVDAKNQADALIYATEKSVKDVGDKVDEEIKKTVQEKVDELKKVKDGDDVELIKKATEELGTSAQKIGEILYKEAQEKAAAEAKEKTPPEGGAQSAQEGKFEEGEKKDGDDKKEE